MHDTAGKVFSVILLCLFQTDIKGEHICKCCCFILVFRLHKVFFLLLNNSQPKIISRIIEQKITKD